jgi:hypothetical protein
VISTYLDANAMCGAGEIPKNTSLKGKGALGGPWEFSSTKINLEKLQNSLPIF